MIMSTCSFFSFFHLGKEVKGSISNDFYILRQEFNRFHSYIANFTGSCKHLNTLVMGFMFQGFRLK